jgi:hypothetical protein
MNGMQGLFNVLGGGSMMGMQDFLSPEQQRAIQQQSMMAMAAKLLQAGGPSTTPTSLGQAIGGAFEAGQGAMQSGQTNAVQQMLLRQKLEEGKMTAKQRENFEKLLADASSPISAPSPLTASQAMLAPQTSAGRPGPTLERASLMTTGPMTTGPTTTDPMLPSQSALMAPRPGAAQPITAGAAPQTLQEFLRTQPPAYLQSLQGMPQADAMKSIQDRMSQSMTYGKPEFFVGQDGKPVAMQYNPFGEGRVVPGLRPSEPTPNEIKILRDLGLPVTLAGVTQLRQAGATNVNVGGNRLNLTPGQEAVDKRFAETYLDWQSGGGADTIGNIAQINTVLQQLEQGKALTGPMVGVQPDLLLAITNPQAADAREKVQEVVQRNLRVVLGSAFTAKEGDALISRAYNPTLKPEQNAARLRKLFEQMSVAAGQKQAMAEYYETNGTLQGYRGKQPNINDFYKALEVGSSVNTGTSQGLDAAIQRALDSRRTSGGAR